MCDRRAQKPCRLVQRRVSVPNHAGTSSVLSGRLFIKRREVRLDETHDDRMPGIRGRMHRDDGAPHELEHV